MPPDPPVPAAPPPGAPPPPETHPDTVTAYQKDGTPIALAPAEAAAAFKAGSVGFAGEEPVHVRLADGRVGSVPGGALAGALGTGATLISPAEARAHQLEQEYGGAKGTAEAFGLGALRGASLGLSDALIGKSETADFLKSRHDVASGLGEAGGVAGLTALTGGGAAVEEGAAGVLGKGLAGRVGAQALRAGAEGAAIGHTEAVSEDALSGGDHKLTGEKYLSSVIGNAILGGGLGAAGALVGEGARAAVGAVSGKLASAMRPKDVESLAEAHFGYAPPGLGDAVAKVQATLAGGGEDIIREAGVQNQSASAKALRATLLNIDGERDAATRSVVDHVDTLLRDGKDIADEARGVLKRDHITSAVPKGNEAAVAEHAASTIASARTEIQSMIGDAENFGQERLLGRMNGEMGRIESRIADAAKEGNVGEQFALLDDAKRAIGSWTRDVKSTSLRTSTDPIALRQARATFEKLDGLYEGLRGNLENEGVWGKAGADQKAINEAWTAQIAADKQFKASLAAITGQEKFGGRVYSADPAKIAKYVGGLTNPNQDLVHQAITNYVKSTRDFVGAIGQSYDLGAAQSAKVARVAKAADAFDTTLKDIGPKLAKANQLKALTGGEGPQGIAGFVLGHMVGGPVGGAIGSAVQQLASPGKNIMRLAQLERVMAQSDSKVGRGISAFFDRAKRAPELLAQGARQAGRLARSTAVVETASSTRSTYERYAKAVKNISDNPTAMVDKLAPHAAGMGSVAPKSTAAMGAAGARAASYLTSIAPRPPPADALTGAPGIPPASEQAKFVRIVGTILHPETLTSDLAEGKLTQDQVQAYATVYPARFADVRAKVQAEMLDHAHAGHPLGYQERVQLGTLFGIEADPTMAPQAVGHAQATFAMPPSRSQGGGGGPHDSTKPMAVAGQTRSAADRIASGG